MRPQPQLTVRLGQCRLYDQPAEAAAAVVGVHHHLGTRARDLVGEIEMPVRRELSVLVDQHVAARRVTAVTQVQHHVLGEGADPVGLRRPLDQPGDRADLLGTERSDDLDLGDRASTVLGDHTTTLEAGGEGHPRDRRVTDL